jgi:hypothetical protein
MSNILRLFVDVDASAIRGEKLYHVNKNMKALSLFQAMEYCYQMGMKPAIIESEEENDALHKAIKGANIGISVWIAGHDMGHEGNFYWITNGRPITYSNWSNGQPDNWKGGQNCVRVLESGDKLVWDDNQCLDYTAHPACEYYKGGPIQLTFNINV